MNFKETYIINSLIEQSLNRNQIDGLKERLQTSENYNVFSRKLLEVIIGKDQSISLLDFLTSNGLSDKFLFIQNKTEDVIEELAELHFKELKSVNTNFLLQSKNQVFLRHLGFLTETASAVVIKERVELKKKFQKFDKLNSFNLDEKDIKTAVVASERKRLKQHLSSLQSSEKTTSKIIAFDFKAGLKYAAIIIFVVGPAIFIINRINHSVSTKDNEVADKHVKTKVDSLPHDTLKSDFKLPVSEKYSGVSVLISESKFGFSSNDNKRISIEINDISGQLSALEIEQKNNQINGAAINYMKHMIDSLNSIKETYTFDKKEGKIHLYSTQLKADKTTLNDFKVLVLKIENKEVDYLKIKKNYYKLLNIGKYNNLQIESNEDIVDRLRIIEKQDD